MVEYVISEDELVRYERMMIGSLKVQGSNIRSNPLSEELKKEREKMLDAIIDKLMETPLVDSGVDSMKQMGVIVESLRGEL